MRRISHITSRRNVDVICRERCTRQTWSVSIYVTQIPKETRSHSRSYDCVFKLYDAVVEIRDTRYLDVNTGLVGRCEGRDRMFCQDVIGLSDCWWVAVAGQIRRCASVNDVPGIERYIAPSYTG